MNELLDKCKLCPHNCLVNRNKGEIGFCRAGNKIKIAKAYLHMWEEPSISGEKGSGTIFFSNCNLRCVFCQNYYISNENNGVEISIEKFGDICLDLQKQGALNINLVTPTHFVPLIIDGIKLAKSRGLCIPIVYNSSGYENVETIKLLDGIVDIYLPDLKYYSDSFALKYSNCKNYFKYASGVIDEMVRQKPKCIFDKNGILKSGVVVRHLLLPNMEEDSKKIIKYLYEKYRNNIYISIMNQYTPIRKCKYAELNSRVDSMIYEEVIDYAWNIGVRNAYTQDGESQDESFIPDWNFK